MKGTNEIANRIAESIFIKNKMLEDVDFLEKIKTVSEKITVCFEAGGKLLLCGNGGSASDAQHLAAEFSGRFFKDRKPLFAEALHVNSSYLTAVSNDYSFEMAYARMLEAMGRPGDILVAISTSGNSANILKTAQKAKEIGVFIIGMTGESGGKLASLCDMLLPIPSTNTPRIQEAHILVGHIICEWVEAAIFE